MNVPDPTVIRSENLLRRSLLPFQRFFRAEAASGIVLLAVAVVALVWANSALANTYHDLWEVYVTIGSDRIGLSLPLHQWINDGLMVIFFFLVGLEIKREVLVGELASLRRAALPIAGAIGGMAVPALIYVAFNFGRESIDGWAIPMATDIAFALGALALLGKRAPLGLRVFLAALAIVDDLGAVLVIALFYTSSISWAALALGLLVLAFLVILNRLDVRHPGIYAAFGVVVWLAFLASGVHATIAGVLLAMTIPVRTRIDARTFIRDAHASLDAFRAAGDAEASVIPTARQLGALAELERRTEDVQSPLQRLEHKLQPWVAFGIMPIFALANAGVTVRSGFGDILAQPVSLGIIFGLVVGKPVGILSAAFIAVRAGLAVLPTGVSLRHMVGIGLLGGIGFTMSLFIANLAFAGSAMLDAAKLGILFASTLSGTAGYLVLRTTPVRS